ncbi:putative protein kinase RLK-Pelle-CrRLK1L-1 family [Helianthus annuus]|nr:putative protein kinase RLK-Pelle-CrRLK1L-1 family [Helianthus annuus]
MSLIEDLHHLRIPFKDIKEATQNFTTLIGRGGYGPVFRGQLSLSGELTVVAVKQLQTDQRSAQGIKEFLTEIQMLSRYKHPNIVSLVRFCQKGNERFLVYEYAEHGSLDKYLRPMKNRCPLTWRQRISICVDAARGLNHLHNHVAKNQRVIHRDIKSGNILLDHNWKAMIADFGLSKLGRANESVTYVITNACGTYGYCDPAYINSGILTKESDVYSFGVVLFEVLCGRLCFKNGEEEYLAPLAQRYYEQKMLGIITDDDLKKYMNSYSMNIFSEIAYKCLLDDRKQRPSMGLVLKKLEKALEVIEIEDPPELQELEEALGLQKLVEKLQKQHFEEACEMHELEEALGLQKLVETLQIQELEEALGLQKRVETLQIQHFEEACEMHELEALGLQKRVETLQIQHCEEACEMHKLENALGLPELEEALGLPELVETLELEIGESRIDYEVIEAIYDMPDAPLSYITRDQVYSHLSTGILVDEGKVWFSIDDDGKTQEMISAMKFVPSINVSNRKPRFEHESRFSKVVFVRSPRREMQVKIRTQFLSSHVTYAAYLVCKSDYCPEDIASYLLIYRLNSKSKSYISYPSKMEESGWWMFELFQTINLKRSSDFIISLKILDWPFCYRSHPLIEGIKFLPIPQFEDEVEIEILEEKNLSPSNIGWDNLLPSDYKQFIYYSNKEMMKKPRGNVIFPTKEEAYSILSMGVLIKVNYEVNIWFWITKSNGKKCVILPPTLASYENQPLRKIKRIPSNESRIEYVLHLSPSKVVGMCFKVPNGLLSTNTTYGCYLVYKMPEGSDCNTLVEMKFDADGMIAADKRSYNLRNLSITQIPVIGADGVCRSTIPINDPKNIQLPRKRKDGWLEVALNNIQEDEGFGYVQSRENRPWRSRVLRCISHNESGDRVDNDTGNSFTSEPRYFKTITICMRYVNSLTTTIPKLIVQGIEFRPM